MQMEMMISLKKNVKLHLSSLALTKKSIRPFQVTNTLNINNSLEQGITNNSNSVIANKTNTNIMKNKLVESTYTFLATQIATTARQLTFLSAERDRVAELYTSLDTEDDSFVGFIGEKVLAELDNAIQSLKVCLEPVTEQLTQKLAEPVEEQLGLGLWKTVVD